MKKTKLPKIAISVGDLNGIGLEILIRSHKKISKKCIPYYFIHQTLLEQGLKLLKLKLKKANLVAFEKSENYEFKKIKKTKNFKIFSFTSPLDFEVQSAFKIKPAKIDIKSGAYAYLSFQAANFFVHQKHASSLTTLPIHKKAWELAGISYKGHTDALRHFYNKQAIMMLGCKDLFVALFTEHIPLKEVSSHITFENLTRFLKDFYLQTGFKKVAVLGFNPHAGDYGVIGGEEEKIMCKAIAFINAYLNFHHAKKSKQASFLKKFNILAEDLFQKALSHDELFKDLLKTFNTQSFYLPYPVVADTAFTKTNLKHHKVFVAMYHDVGLSPLKALHFEKSVNISLNLPIIRTSVDHGTAFDLAYKKAKVKLLSYQEAIDQALKFFQKQKKLT